MNSTSTTSTTFFNSSYPDIPRAPNTSVHDADSFNFNPADSEVATATRNVIAAITKLFQRTKNWFFGSQQSGWHPDESQLKAMKQKIRYDQKNAFYKKLSQILERTHNQWNNHIKAELSDQITEYLQLPTHEEHNREKEKQKISGVLEESLSSEAYGELKELFSWLKEKNIPGMSDAVEKKSGKEKSEEKQLNSREKRNAQQTPPLLSQKQYFFGSSEATWDKISLCIFGDNGILAGATIPDVNATNPNEQRILLFNINNSAFERMDALSAAISAQMLPRQGDNNIASACGDRYFHIITEDPLQGIFHTAIANETLIIPQYLAISYATYNITSKGYAPRPMKLSGNGSAFAPAYGSSYYYSYTNATGQFSYPGQRFNTFTTSEPIPTETLSFNNGSTCVLENLGNNSQLSIRVIRPSTPIFTSPLLNMDFNNQTINQLYGAKTPLLNGPPVTLIAQANNYTTSAVITSLIDQGILLSSRMLSPNSGIGIEGTVSVANCADFPDIYAYARDAFDTVHNYVIMYDVVNASLNSSSIIGGEQTYNSFNLTSPAQPQIGCFSNGTVMIAYLENGRPAFFTFNFLESPVSSPTPTPTPVSTSPTLTPIPTPTPFSAASPTSPSTNDPFIFNPPINLGNTSIPVTPVIIGADQNITTFIFNNTKGYGFSYLNGTLVTNGTILSRSQLYNLTLSQGNATKGSVPDITGCDSQGNCFPLTADPGWMRAFMPGHSNVLITALSVGGVALLAIVGTAIAYRTCIDKIAPFRNRKKVGGSDWAVNDNEKKKSLLAHQS